MKTLLKIIANPAGMLTSISFSQHISFQPGRAVSISATQVLAFFIPAHYSPLAGDSANVFFNAEITAADEINRYSLAAGDCLFIPKPGPSFDGLIFYPTALDFDVETRRVRRIIALVGLIPNARHRSEAV